VLVCTDPVLREHGRLGLRLASQNSSALAFPRIARRCRLQSSDDPACTFPPLPERAEVCVQAPARRGHLCRVALPDLADYQAATGPAAVPPPSELELIQVARRLERARRRARGRQPLQKARIPIGWELLDNPWEACNGLLTFDLNRFPDPAGLIEAVHARGVKFMLWVSPRRRAPTAIPQEPARPAGQQVLDLRQPAALAEFQARNQESWPRSVSTG